MDYSEDLIIAKRNIRAIDGVLKHYEQRRQEDAARVQHLQATVTQLMTQVTDLTTQVALIRAKQMGFGSTT